MPSVVLLPNFCAEEDANWRLLLSQPFYRRLATMWRLLFGKETLIKGLDGPSTHLLRSSLFCRDEHVFAGLPKIESGIPWLMTEGAAESLRKLGCQPWGTSPELVNQFHDKAYIKRFADNSALDPSPIQNLFRIFDPQELRDLSAFHQSLRDTISSWPETYQERWTLKPRFGSSGRGRLPGTFLRVELPALPGAQSRLIDRGGVILEPFLDRTVDVSSQFFVHSKGEVEVLGTLAQVLSTSGSYDGHTGRIVDGQFHAGSEFDTRHIDDSLKLVHEVAEKGFRGPCGIDGFAFRVNEGIHFRSLVELNARFTVGTIVIGLLRRIIHSDSVPRWIGQNSLFRFYLSPSENPLPTGAFIVPITQEEGRMTSCFTFLRPR
ncbi:hypothetical protein K2Y11_00465 [bacterium]|nr:hypothetical protein [bacterium]